MGLFFSRNKPKIKVQSSRKDGFSGWVKCTDCREMIHAKDLEKNLSCCPKCNHHYRINAPERIVTLVDEGSFNPLYEEIRPVDKLEFEDTEKYSDRIKRASKQSGITEAILTGTAKIENISVCLGVMDFRYMGGSMGSVVGERLTRLIEHACEHQMPLIIVSASGGARMQESVLSLMQMAKTAAALARLHEAKIPYISVLTNPTSGGVTASYAALGDVTLAEPGALICFAGPRVIEQIIKQQLPPGAQHSEFLLKHGMIDCIVSRHDLRLKLATLLGYLTGNEKEPRKKALVNVPKEVSATLSAKLNKLIGNLG
ncbi:MAG: acetyl-CoA carboxylase carboxyltransferase subunit beta [Verrucomicrobia bacterium]|nr:acetyl-CoA carboxylase carboxyltransferase subunit beta [Verrucomicrobiota bacterium]